jgi:hypothetical protein
VHSGATYLGAHCTVELQTPDSRVSTVVCKRNGANGVCCLPSGAMRSKQQFSKSSMHNRALYSAGAGIREGARNLGQKLLFSSLQRFQGRRAPDSQATALAVHQEADWIRALLLWSCHALGSFQRRPTLSYHLCLLSITVGALGQVFPQCADAHAFRG